MAWSGWICAQRFLRHAIEADVAGRVNLAERRSNHDERTRQTRLRLKVAGRYDIQREYAQSKSVEARGDHWQAHG
jgi:hypothetical protein